MRIMQEVNLVILVVLILLSSIFSGIETALMSLNKAKVKFLLKKKKKGSEALFRIKQNPHKLIITILIGNNVVNIGAASLATVIFTNMFGDSGMGIATGIMTFLILVFGEITPKTYASQNAERVSLAAARPVEVLSAILSPFVRFFELIARGMSRILGSKKETEFSEGELKAIVTMGREEGILSQEAARIMKNVIDFEDTKVTQIMTPKVDMLTVDGEASLRDVIDFVVKTPYSRYPVYWKRRNKIIGILDVDDVLICMKNNRLGVKVKNIIRKPFFVPESKDIEDLLTEFKGRDVPAAIVVDEYGYVSGLVTLEDIMEEIVGDIFDKSDRSSVYIKKISEKLIRVDAKASVEEVNKVLHLSLKKEKFNTIAGFVEHYLQKIPKKGETIKLKNVTIIVDRVDSQGVKSVKIIKG